MIEMRKGVELFVGEKVICQDTARESGMDVAGWQLDERHKWYGEMAQLGLEFRIFVSWLVRTTKSNRWALKHFCDEIRSVHG
jgi:hypothetical protein